MAEKMSPVEEMAKAYDEEFSKWEMTVHTQEERCEIWRGEEIVFSSSEDAAAFDKFDELRSHAGHRAALRALAECEPTDEARETVRAVVHDRVRANVMFTEIGMDAVRAYILAAAEEVPPSPASIKEGRGEE